MAEALASLAGKKPAAAAAAAASAAKSTVGSRLSTGASFGMGNSLSPGATGGDGGEMDLNRYPSLHYKFKKVLISLSRIVAMMADKQKEDDQLNEILKDWKMLAQKVDYFLFWVFLIVTSFTSFLFIFILPYHNRGKLL